MKMWSVLVREMALGQGEQLGEAIPGVRILLGWCDSIGCEMRIAVGCETTRHTYITDILLHVKSRHNALTSPQCAHSKALHPRTGPSPMLAHPRARPSSAPRLSDPNALHAQPTYHTHTQRNTHRPQHTNRSTSQCVVVRPLLHGRRSSSGKI